MCSVCGGWLGKRKPQMITLPHAGPASLRAPQFQHRSAPYGVAIRTVVALPATESGGGFFDVDLAQHFGERGGIVWQGKVRAAQSHRPVALARPAAGGT